MLSRACAAWLVLLILSPFSAPFSTYDLAVFYPAAGAHSASRPGHHRQHDVPASTLRHAATAHALPHAGVRPRTKQMVLGRQSMVTVTAAVSPQMRADSARATSVPTPNRTPLRI